MDELSELDVFSLLPSDLVSLSDLDDCAEPLDPDELVELLAPEDLRLSVIYQPEPLKIIPAGCKTLWTGLPQIMQVLIGSS